MNQDHTNQTMDIIPNPECGDAEDRAGTDHRQSLTRPQRKTYSVWLGCAFFAVLVAGTGGFLLRGTFESDCTEPVDSDYIGSVADMTDLPTIVSSSLVDNGTVVPPDPSEEEMEEWNRSHNRVTETEENQTGRQLQASGLKEHVPYIIRSKYAGPWYDAELSWDTVSSSHARASLEFNDPVAWELRRSGNYYRVHSLYPGSLYRAELSWDGGGGHPMASVEFHDPVDWQFVPKGGNTYRIVSKYKPSWYDAELSWDSGRRRGHPMVSVEYHDPVNWEVTPAFRVKGYWKYQRHLSGCEGCSRSVTVTWGTEQTYGWSRSSTFSSTVSMAATLGIEGLSQTFGVEASRSVTHTVEASFTRSYGQSITSTYVASKGATALWQFWVETTNNHRLHQGQVTVTHTDAVELTGALDQPPKCLPGYCKYNTGCQLCTHSRGCIGTCQSLPARCRPDKRTACPVWKRHGYCSRMYVAWMNQNCHHSCQCT